VTENDSRNERAYYGAAAAAAAVALRESQMRGKERMRKRLAALSFTEKIKILEKLRDREKIIAMAGLRRNPEEILERAITDKNRRPDD